MKDVAAHEITDLQITDPPHAEWDRVKALVLDALSSPHSKRVYGKALDEFRLWSRENAPEGFCKTALNRYRAYLEDSKLSSSTINVRLTAIRKLAQEAADNGLLAPAIATAINKVKGTPQKGRRLGNWLNREQASDLLKEAAGEDIKALRDRALLSLLVGCGLRRSEAADLNCEHIQQREGRWVIVDLIGKRGRVRSVPMPTWTKTALDRWRQAAGILEGPILRAVGQSGRISKNGITPQAVFLIVGEYAKKLALPFAPHDLRRTFAQLAHRGGVAIEQIQLSLGHDSILTTERYLGIRQNLVDAPCDHLGLSVEF